MQQAEREGDDALCLPLEALADACRAAGDSDAAWLAATRHLDAARRIGGHHRPYFATRAAVDVALDRRNLASARELLVELAPHAAAMDGATASTGTASKPASVTAGWPSSTPHRTEPTQAPRAPGARTGTRPR